MVTWRDIIMKHISQMKATWDEICQTAMNREEWRLWTTNVLVTGRSKVSSLAVTVLLLLRYDLH